MESFLRMYHWWSLCPLYLLACQLKVTVGDSGLSRAGKAEKAVSGTHVLKRLRLGVQR